MLRLKEGRDGFYGSKQLRAEASMPLFLDSFISLVQRRFIWLSKYKGDRKNKKKKIGIIVIPILVATKTLTSICLHKGITTQHPQSVSIR
jgi:hypothetical protein